jgi:trans-aconitate 2-methyltransferase
MPTADWDPVQYERFKDQRAQPFWDLFDLVQADATSSPSSCVDLGCGTGELTAEAAARWGCEQMIGIDSSPAMLTAAAAFASPSVRFEYGEIGSWTASAEHDLVFSNAALHWVPDHAAVLARWAGALGAGGQLAVQVPANPDHASHLASVAVASTEPFLSAMGGDPPPDPVAVNVLPPERYAELLFELGFEQQHVRLQVYPHVMPSTAHIVEWTRGTSLTRFFARLPDALHESFVDAYRDELLRRLGDTSPYLFAFRRILLWGRLPRAVAAVSA